LNLTWGFLSSLTDGSSPLTDRPFEDLCRAHIRAFQKGAEKYAAETQLSKRVDQWQTRLAPLLEEEERRPVFDIHMYGNAVIETMERIIHQRKTMDYDDCDDDNNSDPKSSQSLDFREITQGCPSFEVCRMFLAALSLNNSGNLRFVNNNDKEGSNLRMELLNSNLEQPMETYIAPSAKENF
jgi:condensin-2 complex subunit H2